MPIRPGRAGCRAHRESGADRDRPNRVASDRGAPNSRPPGRSAALSVITADLRCANIASPGPCPAVRNRCGPGLRRVRGPARRCARQRFAAIRFGQSVQGIATASGARTGLAGRCRRPARPATVRPVLRLAGLRGIAGTAAGARAPLSTVLFACLVVYPNPLIPLCNAVPWRDARFCLLRPLQSCGCVVFHSPSGLGDIGGRRPWIGRRRRQGPVRTGGTGGTRHASPRFKDVCRGYRQCVDRSLALPTCVPCGRTFKGLVSGPLL